MDKEFKIGNRQVSEKQPPLVIAEIGINHGGSLAVAKQMVDSAARAGVEVVKHQTHVVEDEMSREAKSVVPGNSDKSIYDIMDDCALDEKDEIALKEYVESKGMLFISTPFSRAAALRLQKMDIPCYKIGSGECNNYPLLKLVKSFGKPVILSTGMNTISSIRKAVEVLEGVPIAILHTTNIYPTPDHLVRLGALEQLKEEFPDMVIGLSDHTVTNHACLGAVVLGASILERHYTDTMDREGPDIICSMDERACRELIEGSKILALQRGGEKKPVDEEQKTIDFAFASIVAIDSIRKGDIFTEDNIWVKRPGINGIPAEQYEDILGKVALEDITDNTQIKHNQIQW